MTQKLPRPAKAAKTMAQQADRHALYLQAVQEPVREVKLLSRVYEDAYGAPPLRLREDFCGSAAVSAAWVESHRRREAWGVDLDEEVLRWGQENVGALLEEEEQRRLHYMVGDVRWRGRGTVDVVAASNFSFYIFHQRRDLLAYCEQAHRNLGRKGVLVLEMMGGPDVQCDGRTEGRRLKGFDYVWEQDSFDPISHRCDFRMHFRFKDGSVLRDAFTYAWRLWSIPDVREVLEEAGFKRSVVYWAETDRSTGGSNGVYRKRDHAPPDPAWLAHLVAVK